MTVPQEVEVEIRRLYEVESWKVGTIAAQLHVHEDVVRRVLGMLPPSKSPKPRKRKVDPYVEFIDDTLGLYPRLRATRMYDMIKPRGYDGCIRTLRDHVAKVRPKPKREAYLRVDPLIGEQAQIDWAHVGKVQVPGGVRTLWLFVMVLAWSRAMWAEFVFDTTAHSLLRSLVRACAFFGGCCRQWLFDNAKTVVAQRYGNTVRFHPLLVDLAGHYNAQLRACAPRKGNQKGRVERTIRYVRSRFLAGRDIVTVDQGNRELLEFIDDIAHKRPHPTQPKLTVETCLQKEHERLLPLPVKPHPVDLVKPVPVDKTAFVQFDGNIYSVPPDHVEQTLTLVADDKQVRLLDGTEQVADHARSWGRRQKVTDPRHREQLIRQRRRASDSTRRGRLQEAVPGIDQLFERWVDAGRNVGSMAAQTVKLLDLYGQTMLADVVREALDRGTSDPGALAQLCEQRRRSKQQPVPINIKLGDHVPDREVIPHNLERYDEIKQRQRD